MHRTECNRFRRTYFCISVTTRPLVCVCVARVPVPEKYLTSQASHAAEHIFWTKNKPLRRRWASNLPSPNCVISSESARFYATCGIMFVSSLLQLSRISFAFVQSEMNGVFVGGGVSALYTNERAFVMLMMLSFNGSILVHKLFHLNRIPYLPAN